MFSTNVIQMSIRSIIVHPDMPSKLQATGLNKQLCLPGVRVCIHDSGEIDLIDVNASGAYRICLILWLLRTIS